MTGLLAITTVFFNAYISLVSLWHYKEKKQWTPCETIILALSGANVAHQLMSYFWMTMDEMDSNCQIAEIGYNVLLVLTFSSKFTIMWDSCLLTFYYCTKLVHTSSHCYTHIQDAILKHVTLAVFLIPLCGLGTCMPMLVVLSADNTTFRVNQHCGLLYPSSTSVMIYQVFYVLLTDILPGVIMVKCCISISIHLAVHLQHIKARTNGAHAPKLDTQIRVIQMSLSLVANFLIYLMVDLYANYEIVVNHVNSVVLIFCITSFYTTGTAIVLIYGKKTIWKTLIHDFNVCLEEYPCLSCLKLPEQKTQPSIHSKVKK